MSSESFQPLSRGPLSEGIYRSLKTAILSGRLSPGERIRELQLSRSFRTSQGPVREALQRLEQEGLVARIPHKGTFIAQITREEVQEVYALRMLIESIAIKRFLHRAREEDIRKLEEYVETMRTAAAEGDVSALVEQDMLFHRYICGASGSKILVQIWSIIHGKARLASATADRLRRHNLNEIAEMHQPLLDSIADGKTDRALDLIKRHIRYLWNRIPQDFWDRIPRESEGEEQGRHPGPNEWNGDWDVEGVVANILRGSPGPRGGNPREQRNLGRK